MKFAIILAVACCGLLVSGCSDQSLMTDEEYAKSRGPAPFSSDPTSHLPPLPNSNPNRSY